MQIDATSLIAEISAAFDGVRRDEGTTLHEGEELDNRGSPDELQRARSLDIDPRWQDVPEEWIGKFPSAFRYLDPKGFRYYLPAVMLWHFKHTHWSEPASADLVYSLLIDSRFGYEHLPELLQILTDEQAAATARWLYLYKNDQQNPERDLQSLRESCWGKYLSE
jgi:hypothetical protein